MGVWPVCTAEPPRARCACCLHGKPCNCLPPGTRVVRGDHVPCGKNQQLRPLCSPHNEPPAPTGGSLAYLCAGTCKACVVIAFDQQQCNTPALLLALCVCASAGVQLLREGGLGRGDGSLNGLWNAQPFRAPPAKEVPRCPAGCARAQALSLQRISHGSGEPLPCCPACRCCFAIARACSPSATPRAPGGEAYIIITMVPVIEPATGAAEHLGVQFH